MGVPGTPRGLAVAHQRWGELPWRELVAPAVALAQDGFAVDAALAEELTDTAKRTTTSAEFRRVFAPPKGNVWHAGDRLVQADLARTLQSLADEGPDAFYRGKVAEAIVAEMRTGGGLISANDLANYEAKLRSPTHGTYRGFEIFSSPPPSSGGTCLVEMLNILEDFDLAKDGRFTPRNAKLDDRSNASCLLRPRIAIWAILILSKSPRISRRRNTRGSWPVRSTCRAPRRACNWRATGQ